jgi:hypothetical protein
MTTVADEATATASTPEAEQDAMAALDRVRLPVETLAEAIPHLRRPFTPEAIRFKVQSVFKSKESEPVGCLIVAYIDARLASERLNRVIPGSWSAEYKPVDGSKMMWCRLTVDGVARTDVGESTKGMSKDLVSDALKRFGPPLDHGDVVGATIEEDAGIASGEGDGTAPGWDGLSEEQIAEVEALIEVEHKLGPGSLDLATVQLMLNGRPEAVEAWLADTRDVLAMRKRPEGDDA